MFGACCVFLRYSARSRGPTQEEQENIQNELLVLQQRALALATHTVDDNGRIVNINNNAGSDQMGQEMDNVDNDAPLDQVSQDEGEVQNLEEMDNIKNDELLNRRKSKDD